MAVEDWAASYHLYFN